MIRPLRGARLLAGTLAWLAACGLAHAAPQVLVLSPDDMLAQLHSVSLMMTFTSTYRQLSGSLEFDPQARTCHIDVRFVVRSLTAPNALIRARTMAKSFLDAADYPQTRYVGDCRGAILVGSLTLRGQTHPFDMALTYLGTASQRVSVHAEGVLDRTRWGVAGLPFALGKNIRISNDIALDGKPPQAWH